LIVNQPTGVKDLIVLLADKDAEFSMQGILGNPLRLGIRNITFKVVADRQGKDPGVFRKCHDVLRSSLGLYDHALVVFDRDGCGSQESREALELETENRLAQNGGHDRCAAVVMDPELEVWVWSESPHVPEVLGRSSVAAELTRTLEHAGYLEPGHTKPHNPKDALDHVLRLSNKRHSSALFLELAQKVGFESCKDPAFLKLKATLQKWFAR
jgi:hypothetical protein